MNLEVANKLKIYFMPPCIIQPVYDVQTVINYSDPRCVYVFDCDVIYRAKALF